MNAPTTTTAAAKNVPAVAATIDKNMLVLTFANGQRLTLDSDELSNEIREAALMHGLKQKLVDAAAIARDTATGRSATIDDKYAAVKEIFDRITGAEPTWNKVIRSAPAMKGGVFLAAMMELTGKPKDAMVTYLATLSKEQTAALKVNPRVAVIMERIAAERAKPKAGEDNSDALLDELLGADGGESGEADGDAEPAATPASTPKAVRRARKPAAE